MNILIISDSRVTQAVLRHALHNAIPGLQVEAWNPARMEREGGQCPGNQCTALIMDYDLGGDLNGIEWYRRHAGKRDMPPALLFSARPRMLIKPDAERAGFTGVFEKHREGLKELVSAAWYIAMMWPLTEAVSR
jgi:DNA-binding NarL/FixJ family response regulator